MKSKKKVIQAFLDENIESMSARLKILRKARRGLERFNARKLAYVVTLYSAWSDYGEETVSCRCEQRLDKAIEFTEQQFMKINKRSDVQAYYHVHILFEGVEIPLPEEFWKPYTMYERTKDP